MKSSSSLPPFPGPLGPGVVATDGVLSRGQIELFDIWSECEQTTYVILNGFKIELFDHLTVCKQMTDV